VQPSDFASFNNKDLHDRLKIAMQKATESRIPSETPTVVVCGGQPGAGKTTIHEMLREENPNVVVINGDEYRQLHPNFKKLQAQYGDDSVTHTQPFANAVVEALIDRLSEQKYNLLIEGTLRNPNVPLRTCEMLKNRGYTAELHVMAVDKTKSWQGTLDRYKELERAGGIARATPKESHDEVVAKLPDNLAAVYEAKKFDRIALFTREKECVYDSLKTPEINPREHLYNRLHSSEQERSLDPAQWAEEVKNSKEITDRFPGAKIYEKPNKQLAYDGEVVHKGQNDSFFALKTNKGNAIMLFDAKKLPENEKSPEKGAHVRVNFQGEAMQVRPSREKTNDRSHEREGRART